MGLVTDRVEADATTGAVERQVHSIAVEHNGRSAAVESRRDAEELLGDRYG